MNAENRLKLDMSTRVLAFSQAHPAGDPGHVAAVAKLDQRVTRARSLVQQELTGHLTVHASVLGKEELRAMIHESLHLLAGIAKAAAVEQPGVEARVRLPRVKTSSIAFLARAQVALEQAEEHKDLFLRYGMPETFLQEFTASVSQYDQVVNQKNAGSLTHVGANADLDQVMEEIMQIVQQLDALNRHRFRSDGELRAAWQSARDVAWPASAKARKAQPTDGRAEPAA